jgi:murein DD-endopeptidase MepM/ murein hydrolase activator NlpD
MVKLLAAAPAAALAFMAVFTVVLSPPWRPAVAASTCGGSVSAPQLDAEGAKNAGIVIGVAQSRGLPPRASIMAIATSLQETGGTLHSINHGDAAGPDSRGLFQQRASWGPEAVRMDLAGAAGLFFDALVKVGSWQTRPLGSVAQEVQKSADSSGQTYARHEGEATAIVGGFKPADCAAPASGPGQPGNPMPSCKATITQGYGPVDFAVEPAAYGFPHFHGGKDLACGQGTVVKDIEYAGKAHVTISNAGYGNRVDVEIQTSQGHFYARYAHLAAVAVSDGATVQVGDLIGWEGSTGASTGPHLHFGVYQNGLSESDTIDPSGWLAL